MVDDEVLGLGPGPARIKTLMETGFERLATELEACARGNGGSLDGEEIRAAVDDFVGRQDEEALDYYRTAWNECLAVIESVKRDTERRFPFERLMVKPFAHLLPPSDRPVTPGSELSRRVLPGFLSALQQMLGPVLLEQYQDRCRELVRIIQTARGSKFSWQDVYEDPTSQVIVNDVLVHISKHFTDLPRRREWLIGVISANMPLSDDKAERGWIFTDNEFKMLIEALFRPLYLQISCPEGIGRLRERYGTFSCDLLVELFRELGAPESLARHRATGTGG